MQLFFLITGPVRFFDFFFLKKKKHYHSIYTFSWALFTSAYLSELRAIFPLLLVLQFPVGLCLAVPSQLSETNNALGVWDCACLCALCSSLKARLTGLCSCTWVKRFMGLSVWFGHKQLAVFPADHSCLACSHASFPCVLQSVQQLDHCLEDARGMHVLSTTASVFTGSPCQAALLLSALQCLLMLFCFPLHCAAVKTYSSNWQGQRMGSSSTAKKNCAIFWRCEAFAPFSLSVGLQHQQSLRWAAGNDQGLRLNGLSSIILPPQFKQWVAIVRVFTWTSGYLLASVFTLCYAVWLMLLYKYWAVTKLLVIVI